MKSSLKASVAIALAVAGAIFASTPARALTLDPEFPLLIPGSTTEAMTWTSAPITLTGWNGDPNVSGRTYGLKFHTAGSVNADAFPNCSSDENNRSPLSDCGVVVKVDGVDRTADSTAYTILNGSQIWIVFPSPWSSDYIELDGTVFTLELAEELFDLEVNPQQGFSFFLDVNVGANSWLADSTSLYGEIVTFDANGGTGDMPPTYVVQDRGLPANTFQMDGKQFAGWATSQSNAANGIVDFAPGANYNGGRATLYAVWTTGSGGSGGSGSNSGNGGNQDALASTGFDPILTSMNGIVLLVAGSALAVVSLAKRKRQLERSKS
jgi:hypothetical protein